MQTLSLGVVVTNYNTWGIALRCVEQVLAHGAGVDRVVLRDDASTIPRPAAIDERVEVVVNRTNLGLVRTLNRALREIGTDLVVLFDSDAYPTNDFAGPVRRAFESDPTLAVAGFSTVGSSGWPTGSSEPEPGVASLLLGQRLHALWLRLFGRGAEGRTSVYTCAMAVRREAVLELGGFDERFDWLDLDHELCMKVHRSRYRVGRLPEVVAFHEGSGTPQRSSERVLRFYKARWLLLTKFGKVRHPGLVRRAVIARLAVEWCLLQALRPFAPRRRRDDLRDKLLGRRLALSHALDEYRPPR